MCVCVAVKVFVVLSVICIYVLGIKRCAATRM